MDCMRPSQEAADAARAVTAWATSYHRIRAQRDGLVRAAVAAGVGKQHLHFITGLARTTIDRIIQQPPGDEGAQLVRDLGSVRELPEDPWAR